MPRAPVPSTRAATGEHRGTGSRGLVEVEVGQQWGQWWQQGYAWRPATPRSLWTLLGSGSRQHLLRSRFQKSQNSPRPPGT